MSGATTELNLATAVDSDDNADYLTLSLANSLRTVDALFNNVTGHTHGSAHQGGPIASIPATAIPDGSITSAKIVDGTIVAADIASGAIDSSKLAAGAALGNLAPGDIGKVIATKTLAGDQWNNVALSGGDNALPAGGGVLSVTIPDTNDLVFVNVNICSQMNNPSAGGAFGWVMYVDGIAGRPGPMVWVPAGVNNIQYVPWSADLLIAGPGTLAGPLTPGAHNIEFRLRASSAISSGAFLMPASAGSQQRFLVEVWVLRR